METNRSMSDPDELTVIVPVVEESLTVDKVAVVTDAVRVTTTVDTHDVLVEETLDRGVLRVERFPIDRPIDAAPPQREEGDTTIISVVEERLVVEKRLFLVEEVHVTRGRAQEHVAIPVTLRRTRATVEQSPDISKGSIMNG